MAAGMPGTGIGGLFYIVSAVIAPIRAVWRRGRGAASPNAALRLAAIAGGVMLGVWLTGWLLGVVLHSSGVSAALVRERPGTLAPAANFLRTASLLLALAILGGVLGAVEILRLLVHRRRLPVIPPLVLFCLIGHAAILGGQSVSRRGLADSLYDAGDATGAARAYAATLAADSANSHATFRLAQLSDDPARAIRLYRRYVALEPSDPWGYLALGDALSRHREVGEALRLYDAAAALAPNQRDVTVGRARLLARAGRLEAAIEEYSGWLKRHPDDAEAWRESGRVRLQSGRPRAAGADLERAVALRPDPGTVDRLRAARSATRPALETGAGGIHDSDANHAGWVRLGADLAVADGARLGIWARRLRVTDPDFVAHSDALGLELRARPASALRLDARGGVTRLGSAVASSARYTAATGRVRLRWRSPGNGPAIEALLSRDALDASPLLITNRVMRSEIGGAVDLPLGPVRLRGLGRVARLDFGAERNRRTRVGGVVALPLLATLEVSGQYHRMSYARNTTAGYFAPRRSDTFEAAAYLEAGQARPFTLALDVGAGTQRIARQGAPFGAWRRALRLFGSLSARLGPESELRLEVEASDAAASSEVVSTSASGWRYGSAALGLRWTIP